MKDSLKLGVVLFLITAICSGLLGFAYNMTAPVIASNAQATEEQAMKLLIEEATAFEEVEGVKSETIENLFVALKEDQAIGAVAKVAPNGYGGKITVLVGFDLENHIKGVKILSHTETPGLGANASNDSFLGQFIEKLPPLDVVKSTPKDNEIAAVTGATITSRAVTDGINEAANYLAEHQQEVFQDAEKGVK